MTMKTINEMTDQEIYDLTDEQIDSGRTSSYEEIRL